MVERNAGLPPERRIEFRVGIHVGGMVEESDGDLMGDGVILRRRLHRHFGRFLAAQDAINIPGRETILLDRIQRDNSPQHRKIVWSTFAS